MPHSGTKRSRQRLGSQAGSQPLSHDRQGGAAASPFPSGLPDDDCVVERLASAATLAAGNATSVEETAWPGGPGGNVPDDIDVDDKFAITAEVVGDIRPNRSNWNCIFYLDPVSTEVR